ncbi:protein kinase [Nocardia sp. NPDC005366]|uniref:serine/threonine-protein kinase n=1 Tax=Nocardia sp. NPDC005366 TaxID=3156878 RepID=UPI0033ACCECB
MKSTVLRTGETFAGYVIKRVLGQGGMGTVYLAQHPRLPRLTALKLLERDLYGDVEMRTRFEREADLVARLEHPNIVTVYDRGAEEDQLWISMQFVPGSDAASADVNVLAPARAVQIIGETAAALDFAHANGVLHRDVKPANILLAKAPIGQPERVLLTDFGIAGMRNSDTTLGSAGTITATLAYAAPEQLIGQPLDHRADQYSLACTLFWMLTGAVPFHGTSPAAVMNGHLYGQVPALRPLRAGTPPALDGVLARAMAKRPDDRFASCTDFAVAARRALAPVGQPRPAGAPYPGARTGLPQAVHMRPPVPPGPGHPRPSTPRQPVQPPAALPPTGVLPPGYVEPTRTAGQPDRPPYPTSAYQGPPNVTRPPHAPPPTHAGPTGSGYQSSGTSHGVVPPYPGVPPHGSLPHGSTVHGSLPHGSLPHGSTAHGSLPHGSTPHSSPQSSGTSHGVVPPFPVPPQGRGAAPSMDSFDSAVAQSNPTSGEAAPVTPEPPKKRRQGRPITIALPDAMVRRGRPSDGASPGGPGPSEARPPP